MPLPRGDRVNSTRGLAGKALHLSEDALAALTTEGTEKCHLRKMSFICHQICVNGRRDRPRPNGCTDDDVIIGRKIAFGLSNSRRIFWIASTNERT